jgi:hypothetical protein
VKQQKKNTPSKKTTAIHVKVKKRLDKYANEVLFPAKLAKANKLLKGIKLPSA